MPCFTLAAAQYPAAAANIACNLERHLEFVAQAAEQQVQLLVFPELSLSGYELADAAELALTLGDPRLQPLAAAAQSHQMTIIVGAPLRSGQALHIAALIFPPTARWPPIPSNICTARNSNSSRPVRAARCWSCIGNASRWPSAPTLRNLATQALPHGRVRTFMPPAY